MRKLAVGALAIILAMAMGLPGVAWAAEQGGGQFPSYDLGDLVVTAGRPGAKDVAISQVITEEDIKATNSRTASEALSHAPGVLVTTNRRAEQLVQIYGLPQEKTLIMIDGVPYYETKYHRLNLDQVPADIIAKIEIIKGAPSVLYGAGALVGVINIITKKAGDKPAFSMTGEAGNNETYRFNLTQGMKVADKVNYWFNYSHRESDGYELSDDFQPRVGSITYKPGKTVPTVLQGSGERANTDYQVDSIWARVGYEPTDHGEYFINMSWMGSDRGMPSSTNNEQVFTTRPAFATFARWGKYDDLGFDLSGSQKLNEKLTLKGKLFYHDHQDDYVSYSDNTYSKIVALSTYHDYFVGGNLTADYDLAEGHSLGAALHYKGDSHKERDDVYLPYAETFSYTGSGGLEYRFTGIEKLTAVAGASYDWFQVDKAQDNQTDSNGNLVRQRDLVTPDLKSDFNPMVGLSYNLFADTRVFASVAHKTRFPTLMELYSSKGGNSQLETEKSVNYTLGVSHDWTKTFSTQLEGFYLDISDWISRDGPGTTAKYQNYGSIKMTGLELGNNWKPIKNLTLRMDYTYVQAKDESSGAVTDKVAGVPEQKLGVGASYLFPYILTKLDLRGELVGSHYDQLPTPQNPKLEELCTGTYFLLNGRVSRVFWEHYELYFAANNVFDKNYETQVYYPGEGRSFWLGLTTRF